MKDSSRAEDIAFRSGRFSSKDLRRNVAARADPYANGGLKD